MLNYVFTFFNINDAHMEHSCEDPDTLMTILGQTVPSVLTICI
jgi:hypothetical protein